MYSKSKPKSRLIYVSDSSASSIGTFKMHKHDWKDWKKKVDSFNRSTADDNTDEIIDLNARRRPQHHRHHHHHHHQHQQQQQLQQRHNRPSRPKKPKDGSRNTGKGLQHKNRHQYQKNIFRHKPASENVERIIVAGLFSLSTSPVADEINAESILSSAHLAVKHINANRSILPHHHLELHWNDTKCDMVIATRILFEMMHFKPTTAILFGDACSRVTVPIAETAVWWNLTQLSYGDTNPVLSDREKYPNFFRTVPSDADFNAARIHFLQNFKWSRVGTIYQDASTGNSRHSLIHEKLTGLLDQLNLDRETDSFSADPSTALQHIKDKDLRIILGDFNETMAKIVFCEAHNHDIYGPKYAWILGGSFRDNWWIRQDSGLPPCPLDDLLAALQGHVTTDFSVLSSSDVVTISGLTSSQYLKQHKTLSSNRSPSKYHGYAYDGIWAVALAIQALLRERGRSPPIREDLFRGERFRALLSNTDFMGVTGRVTLRRGDRVGNIVFKQFQDDKMVDIGEVDLLTGSLKFNGRLTWPGGDPPRDSSHVSLELQAVNLVVHLCVSLLAAVGVIVCILFLYINIRYREHAYIKMSSPNMNNLILIGCILAYFSVFLQGLNTRLVGEQLFSVICSLKVWVFSLGFTLSFGAMFSKTWRVHSIFTNISMNKKVIKDSKLVAMVNLLLLVDFVILVSWQVVDPPILQTKNITSVDQFLTISSDTEMVFFIELCACKYMTTFLIIIYLYKGFLLVVGCFLAWETRNVTMTALNDSKYIGMSVYIIVITCVSAVPVNFLVSDKPDATYLLVSLFIIFGTTVTLCLVFGPKLVQIRKDPSGKKRQMLKSIARAKKENSERDFIKMQMTNKLLLENKHFKELLDAVTRDQSKLERLLMDERSSTQSSPASSTNIEESATLVQYSLLSRQQQQNEIDDGDVVIESIQQQKKDNEFQPLLQQHFQHQNQQHQRCLRMSSFKEETPIVNGRKKSLIRTPSYQGLKFIAELDLKETDILSDCSDSSEENDLHEKI